jgi:putative transposase
MRFAPRKKLPHDVPEWVCPGSVFFVTICALPRGADALCRPAVAPQLLEAVRAYQEREIWYARLVVLMPDHLHALVAFPPDRRMRTVVAQWKSYTAKHANVRWQRDFFDHRLRGDEPLEEKAAYLRKNPVRAGLVARIEEWPWVFEAETGIRKVGTGGTNVGPGGPDATRRDEGANRG